MPEDTVQALRRFNRFYTRKIGALNRTLLDSPFSLTEARVLFELSRKSEAIASDLCAELGLDPGYLSRMLARFEDGRLIARRKSREDARRAGICLTTAGLRAFAELDRSSSAQAADLTVHLSGTDGALLAASLERVRHLLASPEERSGKVILREPRPGELGWVVQRHGELYAAEYGWDESFEALVARIVADFGRRRDPSRERAWMAEMDGCPVGCVFLVRGSESVAKLRLLLVEPSARGRGVGRALVGECVAFARKAGYRKITLWTNSVLRTARKIYEAAGFRLVKSEPHRSFGHDLVGQYWELDLARSA